ncbi:DEAD/DEAH box helicase family protein [Candidatus Pacearchaeota archaeon]|nr:DEAD/DEAH box helicase family protein [Candidatus Pacearchaeota archaeon]
MQFEDIKKESDKTEKSQLKFNADGSIDLPDSVKEDLEKQKKEMKELDIWDDLDENTGDEEKEYNLNDNVSGFNLYSQNSRLNPLMFSNNKTQEDVVSEVMDLIQKGKRVIFIKGVCGTGKSAIALNLAKKLGRASIIVPGKALQKQYMEDYSKQKYVLKDDHKKLKIKVITGRNNHPCLYKKGVSADDSELPCKIEINEKNLEKLKEYLKENPRIKKDLALKNIRRISIAPVCPYWSPIIPYEMDYPLEAEKREYRGLRGRRFRIYNRENGCRYYNQFNSYLDSEVIVFNSMKYKLEMLMNRKPATDVEIIDECDEFLDSFANINRINLTRLLNTLIKLYIDDDRAEFVIKKLLDSVNKILNDDYTGELILRNDITEIKKTEIYNILKIFSDYKDIFELVDEENYCLTVLETALEFEDLIDEAFVKLYHSERGLIAEVAATNLAKKFFEMLDKNKILILMSGTIHSPSVLRDIFGIKDFEVVDAEVLTQGKIEVKNTGFEIDCRYENFKNGKATRENYLIALNKAVEQAVKPILVHVNSFNDLPSYEEKFKYGLIELITGQQLKDTQWEDKENKEVEKFKSGKISVLFTTKCNRGADFPGDQCRSVIFTKYPNPDVDSIFWKILNKTHKHYYWEFYKDKAKREFLQRVYRGVRSKDDWVYVLSPDKRVLDAVKTMNV